MAEGYGTFDHTGDLGLEVWAATPERLYALAAEALMAQVVIPEARPAEVRLAFDLEGDDPADLLVHWLNTALLHAEIERAVWVGATVSGLTRSALRGTLEGPRIDPGRDVRLREVKAVSHHHLDLRLETPDCRCRLVLDI